MGGKSMNYQRSGNLQASSAETFISVSTQMENQTLLFHSYSRHIATIKGEVPGGVNFCVPPN